MSLSPWLIIAIAGVLITGGILLYVWWRRRQQDDYVLVPVCMHCGTPFDEKTWKKRNVREHFAGRYTIVPVFVCPKCGKKLARGSDGQPRLF